MQIPDFFHIGVMKTGTTYLQEVLLEDQRIQLYNHTRFINTNLYYGSIYQDLDRSKITIESDENIIDPKGVMFGLYTSLQRIQANNPNAVIVLTIRAQKNLLISGYKHTIRQTDQNFSFEGFLNSNYGVNYLRNVDYYSVVKLIEKFFPKQQIRIIPFELIKTGKFIETFYKEVFGINKPTTEVEEKKLNKGLTDDLILYKKSLNNRLIFNKDSRIGNLERKASRLHLKIKQKYFSSNTTTKKIIWPTENELCQKMEKQFRISNQQLDKEYQLGLSELGYDL